MAASEVIDYAPESVSVLRLVFVKFNFFFRDYFLALTLAWPDVMGAISLMSCIR